MDDDNAAIGCGVLIVGAIVLAVAYWIIGWTSILIANNQIWLYGISGALFGTSGFKAFQCKKLSRRVEEIEVLEQEVSRRWR